MRPRAGAMHSASASRASGVRSRQTQRPDAPRHRRRTTETLKSVIVWTLALALGVRFLRFCVRFVSAPLNAHRDRVEACAQEVGTWDVDKARARARELTRESEEMSTRTFTVLLNTYKREDLLRRAVRHYERCGDVEEIIVIWSEQREPPKAGEKGSEGFFSRRKRTRYETHAGTSIQNRFDPIDGLATRAVFNVDEDVRIPCRTLRSGFRKWQRNPDALVGYFPRNYAPAKYPNDGCNWKYVANELALWWSGKYSIVLTKAAFMDQKYLKLYKEHLPEGVREYIDKRKNCEDIAMQFLTSSITREAPVYAPASLMYYIRAKLGGMAVRGISSGTDHHIRRGDCITDFQTMFSTTKIPLVERHM